MIVVSLICFFAIGIKAPNGFGYSGIRTMGIAICIFCLFLFCCNQSIPQGIGFIIRHLSKYSAIVYYLHFFVGRLFNVFVFNIFIHIDNSFAECVIIWGLCNIFAFLILISKKFLVQRFHSVCDNARTKIIGLKGFYGEK